MTAAVRAVAERFDLGGAVRDIRVWGDGLINDTYVATVDASPSARAIIQRINDRVFPQPQSIMANIEAVIRHVERCNQDCGGNGRTLRLPRLLRTVDGARCTVDAAGGVWRALEFIEGTRTLNAVESLDDSEEIGFALGRFHRLVSSLDPRCLHDTLPGFHIAPLYFQRYLRVSAAAAVARTPALDYCTGFIERRSNRFEVLESGRHRGELPTRPIHGDPKLDNILFDAHNRRAVSLIDLDTIKPGLIHYDIGDCLRSCCNRAGETPADDASVDFDLDVCRGILSGYCREMRGVLTAHDHAFLFDAIHLIPLELGLRFLTDHLEGNRYFKVDAPDRNLQRAERQFRLVERIERIERQIRSLLDELAQRH